MLVRNILEESVQKFSEVKAVKWLNKKEISERSYCEIMENAASVRKGLLAEGFEGKHIALIGTSSVEWIESYLGIITGCTTAVPLDAALPCEDLVDLINRSDCAALFLSPKHRPYLEVFLENCPGLQKVWMLQEEVEDVPEKVYSINELRNIGNNASKDAACPDAEDIATIIFTSGTTGKSKGVMLTQKNLASNVEAVKISAEPGTVMLSVLPIHHAFCLVMDWLKGFSQGATLCINDSLLHMVRNMSIFKPDIMLMVPMMIETIYKRLAASDPAIPKQVWQRRYLEESCIPYLPVGRIWIHITLNILHSTVFRYWKAMECQNAHLLSATIHRKIISLDLLESLLKTWRSDLKMGRFWCGEPVS